MRRPTPTDSCLDLLVSLDDWQRGFLDSIFSSQNISSPTPAQCSAALKRMTGYVMQQHGGELPPDGRVSLAKRGSRLESQSMNELILDPFSLPYGTEFRNVDGLPVAFVPTPLGDVISVSFAGVAPRHYPMVAADRNGTLVSREAFVELVSSCRIKLEPDQI